MFRRIVPLLPVIILALFIALAATGVLAGPVEWRGEWPRTEFSKAAVNLEEIISGGT